MDCIGDCNKCTNGKCVYGGYKYENNSENLKEYRKSYYRQHKERILKNQKEYRKLKKGQV